MKKILIFTGTYLPGVKGGGPIQSIKNLVDNLSDSFEFYIITLDRDLGDPKPYENVKINEWNETKNVNIYYINSTKIRINKIRDLINSISPDTIYLNSFFSYSFSIMPIILNKLNLINPQKVIIAPRGEFSQGALYLKRNKKRLYIRLVKTLNIYNKDNIIWHLTSKFERNDLKKILNTTQQTYICQNFSANYNNKIYDKGIDKNVQALKLVYLARIHPMKNLNYAIKLLQNDYDGDIIFDIYGPIEDQNYWNVCKENINKLPSNIKVSYKGLVEHDLVLETFKKYHFMLLPTHGENFGHVISESLISGTPVLLSDQTPWRNLANKNVGWDINLSQKNKFIEVIQNTLSMDQKDYNNISKSAFIYGKESAQQKEKTEKMKMIFD